MKAIAHSDVGTVLRPDEYCAVWSPTEGYSFYTPPDKPETKVPDLAIALIAAVVRMEADEEFRQELIDWFMPHSKNDPKEKA